MEGVSTVPGQSVDSLCNVRSGVDCQVVEGSYNLGKGKARVWCVLFRIREGSIRLQWDGEPGAVGLREHAVCLEQVLSEPGLADVQGSSSSTSGDFIAHKDRWFSKISCLVELHDLVFVLLEDKLSWQVY
jgi:hypothetical protein